MTNKVKFCFIIIALTFFLFPIKINYICAEAENEKTLFTPTATPTEKLDQEATSITEEEEGTTNEEINILLTEEKITATPTEESKEESSPINIWQMATFGLVIAFLAVVIGFILGGKKEDKEKPKSRYQKKEEENEEEESEE